MSRQYNMYNVQLSEFWKQRCGKEAIANTPYGDEEFDDDCSVVSEAPSRVAMSQISTTSSVSRAKIAELEAQLATEKKARVHAENQLKSYQSSFYKGGSTEAAASS